MNWTHLLCRRALLLAAPLLVVGSSGCDRQPRESGRPASSTAVTTATSVGPGSTTPPDDIPVPASLALSPKGRAALEQLARAPHFGGWAVGVAGTPTAVVSAWRLLLALPRASEAFAVVLEHGTLAGQLMALAGLYTTDPARFARELPRYRGRREQVRVMTSGCAPGGDPVAVAEVVESPTAVQLSGPDDTLSAWGQRNPGKSIMGFDIAGGGYPAAMKPYRPAPAPAAPSASAD